MKSLIFFHGGKPFLAHLSLQLGVKKEKANFDESSISFPMQMTEASICCFRIGRKQYFLSIRLNLFLTEFPNNFLSEI